MRPISVLLVPTTAATVDDCPRRTVEKITDLQSLVGGFVEQVTVPASDGIVMFGDEDGLRTARPTNALATAILAHYAEQAGTRFVQGFGGIVGDVVFCHYDEDGNEGDVTEEFVSSIRHLRAHLA